MSDYVLVVSVSKRQRCSKRLRTYEHVYCFLDNDKAGMDGCRMVSNTYPTKVIDMSDNYREYKDVNDCLIGREKYEWKRKET